MPFPDLRVLIVPGLHGSGPDHWQTCWQALYPSFERVTQARWDVPDLPAWSERVGAALRQSDRPALIVAHSFGCLASIHCAARAAPPNLVGALLVAPADPARFGISRVLREAVLRSPSIVVGSRDDPWMDVRRAAEWARQWGSRFVDAGALGHINAESRLGDWPFGLSLLRELADAVSPAATGFSTRPVA